MAGTLPTFSLIRQRYQYLRGETDYTTTDAVNDSNINAAVRDVCDEYPFSFTLAKTTGSISSNTFNLAGDYNSRWHLPDARVVVTGGGNDYIFTEIPVHERDKYSAGDYVYWITLDTSNNVYVFNTLETSGTVTYYYHFIPNTMTASTDGAAQAIYCVVPDAELIANWALARNWVGDERNTALKADTEREAIRRLERLKNADMAFGPIYAESSIVSMNPNISNRVSDSGLKISQ